MAAEEVGFAWIKAIIPHILSIDENYYESAR
jgi:hypothetical protein